MKSLRWDHPTPVTVGTWAWLVQWVWLVIDRMWCDIFGLFLVVFRRHWEDWTVVGFRFDRLNTYSFTWIDICLYESHFGLCVWSFSLPNSWMGLSILCGFSVIYNGCVARSVHRSDVSVLFKYPRSCNCLGSLLNVRLSFSSSFKSKVKLVPARHTGKATCTIQHQYAIVNTIINSDHQHTI